MKSFKDIIEPKARDEPSVSVVKARFETKSTDEDKRLAFGWASVAVRADGEQVEDAENDMIDINDLEPAVYQFVEFSGEGGELHQRGGTAQLVESMVFTKEKLSALGLDNSALPDGWWVGFHITDDDVWEKVKDGSYPMFSIEGMAVREEADDEKEEDVA